MLIYTHNSNRINESTGETILGINKKTFKQILLLITFTVLLYWSLSHFEILGKLISSVFGIISPFIVGFCIAFVVNVVLRGLEKLWDKHIKNRHITKFKRGICLTLSIFIVLGIIFAILFIVTPEFMKTMDSFIDMLPSYIKTIENRWNSLSETLNKHSIVLPEFDIDEEKLITTIGNFLKQKGQIFVDTTINITASIFSAIFNFVIAFAFSIYVLAQKESLGIAARRVSTAIFKEEKTDKIFSFVSLVNKSFTNFVTGQLTEAVIIGILCFVGMLILAMPYAPAISVLVGFTALIPVFGAFIGTAVGAFLILLVEPIKALWFIIFIIVLQQLEGNLIYPKVVGKSVGLPGILVLAAVTVGGNAFGIVGMLLSVPICSVIYTLAVKAVDKKLNTK